MSCVGDSTALLLSHSRAAQPTHGTRIGLVVEALALPNQDQSQVEGVLVLRELVDELIHAHVNQHDFPHLSLSSWTCSTSSSPGKRWGTQEGKEKGIGAVDVGEVN